MSHLCRTKEGIRLKLQCRWRDGHNGKCAPVGEHQRQVSALRTAYAGAERARLELLVALRDLLAIHERVVRGDASWNHADGARMAEIRALAARDVPQREAIGDAATVERQAKGGA